MENKKRLLFASIFTISLFLVASVSKKITFNINNISGDTAKDSSGPQLDGDFVVWDGRPGSHQVTAYEIFLYQVSTHSLTQITNNNQVDLNPQVSGDFVVWHHHNYDYDVYLYQISTGVTTPLTSNTDSDINPQIDGDFVVWVKAEPINYDTQIYLYQISIGATTQLTNGKFEFDPSMDGDFVVWQGGGGPSYEKEIYLYQISTGDTTQITNNAAEEKLPHVDGDFIVWLGDEDGDDEVYLYQISTGMTTKITDNSQIDESPEVDGDFVVWANYTNSTPQILLYQISTGVTSSLADNTVGTSGKVSGNYVTWTGAGDGDDEIYLHQISSNTTVQLSNNVLSDTSPQIADSSVVWQSYGYGGRLNIHLAEIHAPTATPTTTATPAPTTVANRPEKALPDTGFAPNVVTELAAQPESLAYASTDLVLNIPSLGVSQTIVGVPQSADGWNVSWLGNGVGYLAGTAFPTWAGNTALTGHVWNADGSAGIFANLDQLQHGDRFTIEAWGLTYTYEVRDSEQVYATNLSVLDHSDYDIVTLITCEDFSEYTEAYRYRRAVTAVLVSVK